LLNRQEPIELECRPVLKDVICRFGEKCFHDVHYLCSFSQPDGSCSKEACIPEDACVFDAIVTNLDITSVERSNGCARVCGNYDLFVFFRFDEQRQVGQAVRNNVPFCVQVPMSSVNDGCQEIVCGGGKRFETKVCAFNTRLEVVEAVAEQDNTDANICPGCNFQANVTFNTRIDDEANTLFGRELIAMTCNPTSTMATIDGAGEFGRGFFSFFFCSLRHLCCHLPPAFLSKGLLF
jgi:hypothetical protein